MSAFQQAVLAALPDDHASATLAGRVWRPEVGGPSVVAIRNGEAFDITSSFATMRDLCEQPDPGAATRDKACNRRGALGAGPKAQFPTAFARPKIKINHARAGFRFQHAILQRDGRCHGRGIQNGTALKRHALAVIARCATAHSDGNRMTARGIQDAGSGFKPGAFHRAGIGQIRQNTLKPLGGSIIGKGHVYPLCESLCAALPGARDDQMVSKGGDIKACATANGQNLSSLTRARSPLP